MTSDLYPRTWRQRRGATGYPELGAGVETTKPESFRFSCVPDHADDHRFSRQTR
jgi:hypothetical protein